MLDDKDAFQSRSLGMLHMMIEDTKYLMEQHPRSKRTVKRNCRLIQIWINARSKDLDLEIALELAFKGIV